MKKKFILWIVPIIVAAFVGLKIYSDAVKAINHPFRSTSKTVKVEVKKGDSLNGMITNLYGEKKIGNSFLIKWYIKNQKLDTNIMPGNYEIPANLSLKDFVKALNKGRYNENVIKVTIPEGYDVDKIASLLDEKKVIKKDEFIKACKNYDLTSYIKNNNKRKYALEGYLFPDTYEFEKGTNGKEIIDIILNNFEKVIKDVQSKAAISSEKIDDIITMASIVEREAEAASERVTVASVFYNRIEQNMQLQSCATVEYALGVHKTIYSYKDLAVDSPYNTYKVPSLPVGPICNPGKDSIIAAANPAQTNYLYFVSKFDGTKTHFFTDNYNQFLKYKKQSDSNLEKLNK